MPLFGGYLFVALGGRSIFGELFLGRLLWVVVAVLLMDDAIRCFFRLYMD